MKNVALVICFCVVVVIIAMGSSSYVESWEDHICSYGDPKVCKLLSTYRSNLSYDKVCWLTSHNSFTYFGDKSFKRKILPNQFLTVSEQLEHGVRSFMIDLHYDDNNDVIIAHGDLKFFEQPLAPFLHTIKSWLNNHKKDIITIHLESYIGNYGKIIEAINAVDKIDARDKNKKDEPKLESYLFDLKSGGGWPTLGVMRMRNKRLVIFSDKKEDVGFGIMHTGSYTETQYNLAQYPNCEMRKDNRSEKSSLLVMNHFYPAVIGLQMFRWRLYYDPEEVALYKKLGLVNILSVNNHDELNSRACACLNERKQLPNFIAMDFIGSNEAELDIIIDINKGRINCNFGKSEKNIENYNFDEVI